MRTLIDLEVFKRFCAETGRPWAQYVNVPVMLEFADWVIAHQNALDKSAEPSHPDSTGYSL